MEDKPKIIQIVRPAIIGDLRREINWIYDNYDLRDAPVKALFETIRLTESLKGPTAVGNYIKANQILSGNVLLFVDERVSRELEISKVTVNLSSLIYPSEAMEVRFADSGLPAILLSRVEKGKITKDGNEFGDSGIVFACDKKDGATLTLSLPDSLWADYVAGQFNEHMSAFVPFDQEMENEEGEAMRYMTMLAIKVLAYSSIPQFGPKLLSTKAEKKSVGIHPKHIISTQKVFSIRYLPRVVREKEQSESISGDKTRRFLGRAGTLRHYEDERYTNMRGKIQWIPPISAPEGIKVIYKIRKPSL